MHKLQNLVSNLLRRRIENYRQNKQSNRPWMFSLIVKVDNNEKNFTDDSFNIANNTTFSSMMWFKLNTKVKFRKMNKCVINLRNQLLARIIQISILIICWSIIYIIVLCIQSVKEIGGQIYRILLFLRKKETCKYIVCPF